MQGSWWELKIQLSSDEYIKLKDLAVREKKDDLSQFVHEIIIRFLEAS